MTAGDRFGRAHLPRAAALAVCASVALGVVGCSSTAQLPPAYTPGATGTSIAGSTTGTPATGTSGPATPSGLPTTNTITVTPPAGLSPDQQAAYDAYAKYMAYVATGGLTPANPPQFGEVAIGEALAHLQSAIATLKQQGKHTVGATKVTVATVTVSGATAKICATMVDTSVDVDGAGKMSSPGRGIPEPLVVQLTKPGPTWLVSSQTSGKAC